MFKLSKNERLVYAGKIGVRTPDGSPLPDVPQYIIVPADNADPTAVTPIEKDERVILAGRVFTQKKRAEERFAALKAGQEQSPREDGIPLYIKEYAANVNSKTGFTEQEEKANKALSEELLEIFALQMRKREALEKQTAGATV